MMGSAILRKDITMCAEMRTITPGFKRVKFTGDAPAPPVSALPALLRYKCSTLPRLTGHRALCKFGKIQDSFGATCRYHAIQKRFKITTLFVGYVFSILFLS